jgi:YegS/Rv2252/BmrU family lipid kinase
MPKLAAALIYNRRAGRVRRKGELLDRILACLSKADMNVEVFPTQGRGDAIELAARASRAGFDRVLSFGGDGTLNEVAAGLLGTETVLGVLPGGTVNVFAREVGIPRTLEGAIDVAARGEPTRIPVGMAGDRPFLLMAGVGLDAEVVYRLKAGFKDALGALAFWVDGFRLLATYPMTPLRIRAEGREIAATTVIAGKLRRFGPRYFITREARLEEPKLHVVVFKGRKGRDYLRYLAGVLGGFHLRMWDVEHFKTDALEVSSEGKEKVPLQIDGEPLGFAPVSIGVRDRALTVMLPRKE